MSANMQSRVQKGISTGGQFSQGSKSEASGVSLRERPVANETKLHVPEGQFSASDANTEWGRDAVRAGAMRRYGVSGDELDKAAALVNDGRGGRQKAREAMGLNDAQLDELTATQANMQRRKGPYFINGNGSRAEWATMTASGMGQVPLDVTSKPSVYRIPAPVGRNDTVRVTEGGMIEFADAAGNTTLTDGEGVNRILDARKDSPSLTKYELQFGAKASYDAESGVLRVQAGEVSYSVGKDFEVSGVAQPNDKAPGRFMQDLEPQARELHKRLTDSPTAISEVRRTSTRKNDEPRPVKVESYLAAPTSPEIFPPTKRTLGQRIGRLFGRR